MKLLLTLLFLMSIFIPYVKTSIIIKKSNENVAHTIIYLCMVGLHRVYTLFNNYATDSFGPTLQIEMLRMCNER